MNALDGIRQRAEAATNLGEWETTRANDVVIYAPNGFGAYRLIAHADAAADAEFIAHARTDIPRLLWALDAVLALADKWRYKGEFGWGAWQEGHGPDPEGAVLDAVSLDIRAAVNGALEGK